MADEMGARSKVDLRCWPMLSRPTHACSRCFDRVTAGGERQCLRWCASRTVDQADGRARVGLWHCSALRSEASECPRRVAMGAVEAARPAAGYARGDGERRRGQRQRQRQQAGARGAAQRARSAVAARSRGGLARRRVERCRVASVPPARAVEQTGQRCAAARGRQRSSTGGVELRQRLWCECGCRAGGKGCQGRGRRAVGFWCGEGW